MASAVGKTPPKPPVDVKKEKTPSKDQQDKQSAQQNASKDDKNQDNKPRGRENRFQNNDNRGNNQNRRGGFGNRNQNPRFNQRGNQQGRDNSGGNNQYSDQSSGDFYGEQNDGPKEPKKFTGRCRLFVGNITPDTTEEQFKEMFASYGEVSEVFVNAGRGFGFIRLDYRINAEKAKMELDGQMRNGRVLRVRFATHGAALKVYNLSPFVSNELLEKAFSQFGEIERAIVCVDDRGRSCGEGIVEFSRKPGAQAASKRISEGVFLLSSYPRPVRVEMLEQKDEEDGLTEKFVQKNDGFRKDREKEPRFAPPGSFEFEFGQKHRQIDDMEKERVERVKQEMEQERARLADEMETAIFDYQAEQIRQDLMRQQEELKRLDEMKNEHMRRRQEMDMRRQEQQNRMGGMGDNMMRQEEERRREMMMRASSAMDREREGMNSGPPGPNRMPPGGGRSDEMMRGPGGPGGPGGMREGQGPQRGPGTPPMPPPPVPPGMNMENNRPGRASFVGQAGNMEGPGRFGPGGMPGGSPGKNMDRPNPGMQGGMKGEQMILPHRFYMVPCAG
ncbi:Paraspeckle component 1 [Mactra antiquata]